MSADSLLTLGSLWKLSWAYVQVLPEVHINTDEMVSK